MSAEYIEPMFRELLARTSLALPARCEICHAWPTQPLCEACVARFAQPQARCTTCALPVVPGVSKCGVCQRHAPPLDACLAALPYAYPWSGCIARFKFNGQPGWARAFATLMRSTPWVEPALEACQRVLPMPLSERRLRERGFNQALQLARRLAPDKADATLLLRLRDTSAQHTLPLGERLRNVQGAFVVDPLCGAALRGQRVVLVDDVMTSGASLFSAALALREAGASHITALVLARTDEPGAAQ